MNSLHQLQALLNETRPFILLEDRLNRAACAKLFYDPVEVIRCDKLSEITAGFTRIEDGLKRGLHAAGFCAYELGYALEPKLAARMPPPADLPLFWFGLFHPPHLIPAPHLDAIFAQHGPPPPITDLILGHDRQTHARKIGQVLELIRAGDIYQANLTFPIHFCYRGDPLALYAALRARQPVAHGGIVALETETILSVSPELFVTTCNGTATVRPMKGTAARSPDPVADRDAQTALASDAKQRAENLMIVDLLRNDLARISQPGSVKVPALFTVESYPTFHALTSTITSKLRPDVGLHEQFAALFPCGSIIGAPKIRAAEIIRELEETPRGVYSGAIGSIAPNGDMSFNVAIRTARIGTNGSGSYGVGGGIVANSDPASEYDEALLKARVLTDLAAAYGLIETFRWSKKDGFIRLERHLNRLQMSAQVLAFQFDRLKILARLDRATKAWCVQLEDQRVRLELARNGTMTISAEPTAISPARPLELGIATAILDAGDPFLRHKTTVRGAYDLASAEMAARGLDEAILLNRAGAVADGARNSLFAKIDGRLVTPSLAAGALPGVLRSELIEAGHAVEGDLRLKCLRRASQVFIGNSLHGLRKARIVDGNDDYPTASSEFYCCRSELLLQKQRNSRVAKETDHG